MTYASFHTKAREMEKLFRQLLALILLTQLALCTPAESSTTPKGSTTEGPTDLTETEHLRNEISSLKEQIKELFDSVEAIKMETSDSVSRLRQQLRGDVGQLLADVRAQREEQQKFTRSITERVDGVNETIQTLNTDSEVTNASHTQLSTLQSTVSTLIGRINTPVDLYRGCTRETRSCRMSTFGSSNYYWRSCNTRPSLYINPAVSCVWID